MRIAALIVAGGRGLRAARAGVSTPKQYAPIGGLPVIRRTVDAFAAVEAVTEIVAVIHPEDDEIYTAAVAGAGMKIRPAVFGGATRQQSVLNGLEALAASAPPDIVLIHDAARPYVSATDIASVVAALQTHEGALSALPVSDTLKSSSGNGLVAETLDRAALWRAQTPQGFRFPTILKAHRDAAAAGRGDFTDDAAVAEWAGIGVALVEGSAANIKLTTVEDMAMADTLLGAQAPAFETRTGSGFDVHRFTEGDHVWLGGVKIPHTHKLDGHSDADVVLHALTDALLGTIGDGDIGQHFPPSDPQWKGAASHLFLRDAARRVAERGGKIINVDLTILAEAPKIGPHRPAMQHAIGNALGLTPDRIGIKATTMEQLGFIGRREGIAAMATATVLLPASDAR